MEWHTLFWARCLFIPAPFLSFCSCRVCRVSEPEVLLNSSFSDALIPYTYFFGQWHMDEVGGRHMDRPPPTSVTLGSAWSSRLPLENLLTAWSRESKRVWANHEVMQAPSRGIMRSCKVQAGESWGHACTAEGPDYAKLTEFRSSRTTQADQKK